MNFLDYIFLIILFLSSLIGFFRGFIKEFLSLSAYLVSFVVAVLFAPIFSCYLNNHIESLFIKDSISYISTFIVSLILCSLVSSMLSYFICQIGIANVDRFLGMIFGLLRGMFLIVLIVLFCCCINLSQENWWNNGIFIDPIMMFIEDIKLYIPYSYKLKDWLP
ncbi:membrane protein required for colicin V production [Candidatus Kinetoplastibacterium desouzaii TCC079E]|uniref:Membrane protein required for colicin V production n=1 Tax=Candidatus Kinetoplastidibacterium desouzai TCC079E TaxID=1208919 RepID=M1LU97_9PROT|nr:CvpA family protein [Candidatus Kinetoplastibacterium desouzaii]AGF46869.1 membrane protein required for colicin V production [Candidatus Kinetoplastibacterium desouzaii TCC079E]